MNTECSDISSGLAANPEDSQVTIIIEFVKLALMNGTDAELSLDGRNQRRPLEESSSQGLECPCELGLASWEFIVKTDDAYIFLSGALLRLDQTSRTVYAHDKTSGNFRIECSTVSGLFDSVN